MGKESIFKNKSFFYLSMITIFFLIFAADDSVFLEIDPITTPTNNPVQTISGRSIPQVKIVISETDTGEQRAEGMTDSKGNFAIDTPLEEGSNFLTVSVIRRVTQCMPTEKVETSVDLSEILLDTIPPIIKITLPSNNLKTKETKITVSGSIEDANQVKIKVNSIEAIADKTSFTAENIPLDVEGINIISAIGVDIANNIGSDQISVIRDTTPPLAPTKVKALGCGNVISIMWELNTTDYDFDHYNIYRTETPHTDFVLIGSTKGNIYKDTDIKVGKNYYYVVTSVDLLGNESAYSEEVASQPKEPIFVYGDIRQNTTWTKENCAYVVEGNVKVYGTTTNSVNLTIEEGVQVMFKQGAQLTIGYSNQLASLNVQGTKSAPVIFTAFPSQDPNIPPTLGYWNGIYFEQSTVSSNTSINHAIIEYAGGGTRKSAISLNYASPKLGNLLIKESSGYGIRASYSSFNLANSTITKCSDYGVYIDGNPSSPIVTSSQITGLYFTGVGDSASFKGNIFKAKEGNPAIYTELKILNELLNENTFQDIPSGTYVKFTGGTLKNDLTLPYFDGIIYNLISSYLRVTGTIDYIRNLTIQPGVTIEFSPSTAIQIGDGSNLGTIIANGTQDKPIKFTSISKTSGSWDGILFYAGTQRSSILDNCIVEYGGGSSRKSNIYIENSSPTIKNSLIQKSSFYGISLYGSISDINNAVITNVTVKDNVNYSILIDGNSNPTITGSTFSSGMKMLSSANPTITGNIFENYHNFPLIAFAYNIGSLTKNNTFLDVFPKDQVFVKGGTLSKNATWPAKLGEVQIEYSIIDGDISVGDTNTKPILTLEPGTTLKFETNRKLNIGYYNGGLRASGTKDSPITFTSSSKTSGSWGGVFFHGNTLDEETILDNCIFEYGGSDSGNKTNIYIYNASPTIQNSIIRNSSYNGIRIINSNPNLINLQIIDNENYGIYVRDTSAPKIKDSLSSTGIYFYNTGINVTNISGNIFKNYHNFPLYIGANSVSSLLSKNSFSEVLAGDKVFVYGERITGNAFWPAKLNNVKIAYEIPSGYIAVEGESGITATLTLEEGATLSFASGTYMQVGYWGGGSIIAKGREENPITFTATVPTSGSWNGIFLYDKTDDSTTLFDNTIIEYAGKTSPYMNLYISSASPTIQNSVIRNSNKFGIYIDNSSPILKNLNISGNSDYGIYIKNSSSPTIQNSRSSSGIYFYNTGINGDNIVGNLFENYESFPLYTGANIIDDIIKNNNFTGVKPGNIIYIYGETINKSGLWPATLNGVGIEYHIYNGSISIYGDSSNPAILTLEEGLTLKFMQNGYISVGSSPNLGGLIAQGSNSKPITFSSTSAIPGSWQGINFNSGTLDTSTLKNCIIEYAGSNSSTRGAIYIVGSKPNISNSIIRSSIRDGLYILNGASPTISNSLITGNTIYGVNIYNASLTMTNSTISQNSSFAVNLSGSNPVMINYCNINNLSGGGISANTTNVNINALTNWWGASSGPSGIGGGSGSLITGVGASKVLFDPWFTEEINTTYFMNNASVNPNKFKPGIETTTFSATFSENSNWEITIKNSSLIVVKRFSGTGLNVSQIWDGTDNEGNLLADGIYSFTFSGNSLTNPSQKQSLVGTLTLASSSGFTSADVDLYENEPTTDSIISINELALKNIEILNNLISIDKDNQFTLLELILSPNKIKNIRIDEIKSEIRIERVYQIPLEKWQIIHNKPYNIELILPNGNILNFISENNDEELIFSSNAGKLTIVEEDKMMYLFENEDNKIYIDRDGNIDLIDNKFNTIIIERDNDELGILIYRK